MLPVDEEGWASAANRRGHTAMSPANPTPRSAMDAGLSIAAPVSVINVLGQ